MHTTVSSSPKVPRVIAALLGGALLLAACASDPAMVSTASEAEDASASAGIVAEDSAPREMQPASTTTVPGPGSAALAACQLDGAAIEVDTPVVPDWFWAQFDQVTYRPGDAASLLVEFPELVESITGDEWMVQCYNGTEWVDAWLAIRIFREDAGFAFIDDGWGTDDDGWQLSAATIVIPPNAPNGAYRIRTEASFYETMASAEDVVEVERTEVTVQASFTVDRGHNAASAPEASTVLAACGGPTDGALGAVASAAPVAVVFESENLSPGDTASFTIEPEGQALSTGDEWLVECWDGTEWKRAWIVFDVPNDPTYVYLDEEVAVTDDGYEITSGGISIPPDAPAGLYRIDQYYDQATRVQTVFTVSG